MIYALINDKTDEIKYIGKTVKPLQKRLRKHIYESKNKSNPKSSWIQKIGKENIDIIPIEKCKNEVKAEVWWMDYLEFLGCDLVNEVRYELPNGKSSKIDFKKKEKQSIIQSYKNFTTTKKISKKFNVSESVIKRILNEENVDKHTRSEWVQAGKIDSDKLEIEDNIKQQIITIYKETNNLSKACREVGMEKHYEAIRKRISGRSDDPKDNGNWL